jgi:hypothetical protein
LSSSAKENEVATSWYDISPEFMALTTFTNLKANSDGSTVVVGSFVTASV